MANIVALVDPDPERRRRFIERVRGELALVDGLRVRDASSGDLAVLWAAPDRAPVCVTSGAAGAAFVWGDAFAGPEPSRLDAEELTRAWDPRAAAPPQAFDGFHALLRYEPGRGLRVGADLLGLFPVYYGARGGVLVVGTSPELFRHHPLFPQTLDPRALTALLLLHALLDGRALTRGVRRLRPGHVLAWRPGEPPRELPQYTIPVAEARVTRCFDDDVAEVDAAFADAMRRHVPSSESVGILLSGGRDSRQLAGYLHERDVPICALTMGTRSDHEMRCATAVARTLGCRHVTRELATPDFAEGALRQARWEQLAGGFSTVHTWGTIAPLRELPARFVSGYLRAVRELEPLPVMGSAELPDETRRGIAPATLRRLLRANVFEGLVDDVLREARSAYESICEAPDQRAWRWYLAHGSRTHAGAVPWRLSFGSWPVLPILDRRVLEVLARTPESSLADRRAQDAILRTRFPRLARLPLDRNSTDTLPLEPTRGQRMLHRVRGAAEPLRRRLPGAPERRYYHRIYDIDGEGWRAIRWRAEPHRERLAELFDMEVLASLVPPPDSRMNVQHRIRDTFGSKLLIGLMLWSADHLV